MQSKKIFQTFCALTLMCGSLFAQTVSSSLIGTVLDPANAVVPNAAVTLTDTDTGAVRSSTTAGQGVFRFLNLSPGNFSVSVVVTGFKTLAQHQIVVEANQTRDLGKLQLALGSATDTVSVTAEAAAIQLASSEKAAAIE